jgi:hypothetical protein
MKTAKAGWSYPKVNVERWRAHVEAAVASGQSLAGYAREQGLSRHTLYAAQGLMRRSKATGDSAARSKGRRKPERAAGLSTAFVPVAVPVGMKLMVQLPNGVQLQCEAAAGEALRILLNELAGLRCLA